MIFDLVQPDGLEEDTWVAITDHTDRLERARQAGDLELMIGTAKDLVETIAKAAVTLQGEVVASNAKLPCLITDAHRAFERLPSRVEEEDAHLCVDLAMLWSRWALGRLARLLAARPDTIVAALHDINAKFTRGRLREWLADNLQALEPPSQRLVGAAVAHRAMKGTFTVNEEGVDACAEQPDLTMWPEAYRAGLLEGLFLNRDGHVDVTPDGAKAAAQVIAPHPQVAKLLGELVTKIRDTTYAYRFGPQENWETSRAMNSVEQLLAEGDAREAWQRISKLIDIE